MLCFVTKKATAYCDLAICYHYNLLHRLNNTYVHLLVNRSLFAPNVRWTRVLVRQSTCVICPIECWINGEREWDMRSGNWLGDYERVLCVNMIWWWNNDIITWNTDKAAMHSVLKKKYGGLTSIVGYDFQITFNYTNCTCLCFQP